MRGCTEITVFKNWLFETPSSPLLGKLVFILPLPPPSITNVIYEQKSRPKFSSNNAIWNRTKGELPSPLHGVRTKNSLETHFKY